MKPRSQVRVDQLGHVVHNTFGQCAIAWCVVTWHQRERARIGVSPGGQAGDEAGWSGTNRAGEIPPQSFDVRFNLGSAGVQAAGSAA